MKSRVNTWYLPNMPTIEDQVARAQGRDLYSMTPEIKRAAAVSCLLAGWPPSHVGSYFSVSRRTLGRWVANRDRAMVIDRPTHSSSEWAHICKYGKPEVVAAISTGFSAASVYPTGLTALNRP